MKKAYRLHLLVLAIVILGFAGPAAAQTETPPSPTESAPTGEVTGVVVNQSQGGETPEVVEVMLHAWDQMQGQKFMLHEETTPEGDFTFEEVPLEPGLFYAVMANYQEASYLSEPHQLEEGEQSIDLQVPIYESSSDASQVSIEQMHVLFHFSQGGLAVSEIYILSNNGEHTLKEAITLAEGTRATLEFPLPEDAANLRFEPDPGGRYVRTESGFADTAPLVPGQATSQFMVTYVLPYEESLSYQYTAPLDISGLDFLYPQEGGIEIESEALTSKGSMPMGTGANVSVYAHPALQAGEIVELQISGEPPEDSASMPEPVLLPEPTRKTNDLGLGIGGIVLGLALVGVGVWWWRRPQNDGGYPDDFVEDPDGEGENVEKT